MFHWMPDDASWTGGVLACTWDKRSAEQVASFNMGVAWRLLEGQSVDLPTCPACALLLDEALRLAGLTGGENVEATVSP